MDESDVDHAGALLGVLECLCHHHATVGEAAEAEDEEAHTDVDAAVVVVHGRIALSPRVGGRSTQVQTREAPHRELNTT